MLEVEAEIKVEVEILVVQVEPKKMHSGQSWLWGKLNFQLCAL